MIKDSIVVNFGEENECDFKLKIEIKDNPCKSEELVKIKVFGKSIEYLNYIEIYQEENKLSSPDISSKTEDEEENVVFDDSIYAHTDYIVESVTSAIAATSLLEVTTKNKKSTINTKYSSGSNVFLTKQGDICVKMSELISGFDTPTIKPLYGSVNLTYKAKKIYKEYTWKAPLVESDADLSIPFFVFYQGEKIENFDIVVKTKYEPIEVKFIIKDIGNESIIPNATVHITNLELEYDEVLESDERGECIFTLIPGETYDIKTTASGYIDSNQDFINNDRFTVPVPDEQQ